MIRLADRTARIAQTSSSDYRLCGWIGNTQAAQANSFDYVIACYEIVLEKLKSVSGVSQGKRQKECNRQSDK